jgi:hypothetical protein
MFMPQQDKTDDMKDRFREDIFKPTIGNENLHEISNDNGPRVVNFATSKNLIVKVRCTRDQGPVEGSREHGNEPSGSIKYWEVLA